MKTNIEIPGLFLPEAVRKQATDYVVASLEGIKTQESCFIVNDSLLYRQQPSGKITPCVMNSATYISSNFQSNLGDMEGARGETKINDQSFDGLIEISYRGPGSRIKDKNKLLEVLHGYIEENDLPSSSIYSLFPMFYGMYVDRGIYNASSLNSKFHHYFEEGNVDRTFKVGVEFETGNIASSFRALNKLFILFQEGAIDAGVFITCKDKANAATRIWPVSNRNGSFQELNKRNYKSQISLPIICIGFEPDGFSPSAPFLGRSGNLYHPKDNNETHTSGDYKVLYGEADDEILWPL